MSMRMNRAKINALASELAKDLKTPEDLSALSRADIKSHQCRHGRSHRMAELLSECRSSHCLS